MITRRASLGLIGAALLSGCGPRTGNAIRVGSKNSRENATIAEIYAAALEREHIRVERSMNIGDSKSTFAALVRGDIDLYPGDAPADAHGMRHAYEQRYGVTVLARAPVNESPCLVTSQYAAEEYWLLTLRECAKLSRQLRLAATADFLAPGGALQGLQHRYGGFRFKQVLACDPDAQYGALNRGEADVATAFTTAPNIAEGKFVILRDDKGFWPRSNVAPLVRLAALQAHPRMRAVLDRISPLLTQYAVQRMNMRLDLLALEPRDVAENFISGR